MIVNKKGDLSAVHPVHQLKCSYYYLWGWIMVNVDCIFPKGCILRSVSVFVCAMAGRQFSFSTYGGSRMEVMLSDLAASPLPSTSPRTHTRIYVCSVLLQMGEPVCCLLFNL